MPAEAHEPPHDQPDKQRDDQSDDQPGMLAISLMGDFRVTVAGREIATDAWSSRRAGDLVKLLAMAPGHRLHAEQAMERLWPEAGAERAARNLQQALHRARRVLEPDLRHGPASRYLKRTPEHVLFLVAPGRLAIDTERFLAARAAARRSGSVADLAAAVACYPGDLLPHDAYADWTIRQREVLREAFIDLLFELARRHEQDGRLGEASAALLRLVEADPAHEDGRMALMRLSARLGRRYEALRQYQQLRAALRRELDTDPSPVTQRLYDAIRSGALADPTAQPPLHGGGEGEPDQAVMTSAIGRGAVEDSDPSLLAGEGWGERFRTSFIGRARETEAVTRLLETERLVTLRGAGGSGKTRLAARVAFGRRGAFPDGVWWVELAPLAEGRLVAQTVAAALEVREEHGRPLIETLARKIGDRNLLLVLDNCEHVVEAAAALAAALLAGCPRLRILTTSRRPLHVPGERAWQVPAMMVPHPDDLPPFEHLAQYDAIQLFVARAAAHRPGFALSARNGLAVVRICARLDGIPLAIELAAARLRLLDVEDVAARLDDALVLLASADTAAVPRQRTLRAVLDWSHTLLGAEERVLFRRLAVFAGGWDLGAAEVVCASDGLEGIAREQVLDLLERLADASLVVVEEREGHTRHRLLEMVRRYALDRLEAAGEREAVSRRHAEWCAALAEQGTLLVFDRGQDAWRAQLVQEIDNARAALRWTAERKELAIGLRLAGALRRTWYLNNLLDEGRRWLDELIGAVGDDTQVDAVVLATAYYSAAQLAGYQGDFARVEAHATRCLDLYQAMGDAVGLADAVNLLGDAALDQGQYARATELHQRSLELAEAAGDPHRAAIAFSNLADIAAAQGEVERATVLYTECLTRSRRLGDWRKITMSLVNLGKMAARQGDAARATTLLEEALALNREMGERRGQAEVLVPLGALAREGGDCDRAQLHYTAALTLYAEAGNRLGTAQALEGLAHTAHQRSDPARAARLLGAANAMRERLGAPVPPAQAPALAQLNERLCATLGARDFAEAWTRGGAAPLERIIAEASAPAPSAPDVATSSAASARSARRGPPPAKLTGRERQVAGLVARGLTDKQIAEALMTAERTASKHVANILGKLRLASRRNIAAWWRTHAPPTP